MRIRVRVTALVERSPQTRQARETRCSYQSRTQITFANQRWAWKNHFHSARGDDVVHRLSGGANRGALAQPMNNVGKAIRDSVEPSIDLGFDGVSPYHLSLRAFVSFGENRVAAGRVVFFVVKYFSVFRAFAVKYPHPNPSPSGCCATKAPITKIV
jgi:hypothetical protein